MTRYIAVPVWFPNYRKNGKVLAVLPGTDPLGDPDEVGVGDTEEEAFSDLLTKLGYKEAAVHESRSVFDKMTDDDWKLCNDAIESDKK